MGFNDSMQDMETNIANPEVIAELLMKTSHAHHASFAAINGEDPEWTKWDGDHMAVDMSTELGVTIRTEVLGGTLAELDEQQQAQVPDAQWPAYYAQVRAAELRPSELAAHFRSVKDGLFVPIRRRRSTPNSRRPVKAYCCSTTARSGVSSARSIGARTKRASRFRWPRVTRRCVRRQIFGSYRRPRVTC